MKMFWKVFGWIVFGNLVFFAFAALCVGGYLSAALLVLGALLMIPIGFFEKLRNKIKLNKPICIVLAVALLFGGILVIPTSETSSDNNLTSSKITETVSDVTSETDETVDTLKPNTSETVSKTEDTSSVDKTNSKPESTPKPEINKCAHTQTTIKNQVKATCTENGYSGDIYCDSCEKMIKKGSKTKATGHDTEVRNKKKATTTSGGYTGDKYCTICDAKISTGKVIPKIKDNTKEENNSQTVYITETGRKYHSTKHCSGLNNANKIYDSTVSKAQDMGLTPCSKCH